MTKEKFAEYKHFGAPEEVRTFEKARLELVSTGRGTVGVLTLEPGWRRSVHLKSGANADWFEAPHFQYQISGRLHITMADGTEFETVAGDFSHLTSGHDAWVVGNEPVVVVDWSGATLKQSISL